MKFFVIADKNTVLGFSITGIKGIVANNKEDTIAAIKKAINQKETGIILITERLAKEIKKDINNLLCYKKNKCHLILQIPDVSEAFQGKSHFVEEFVHSALGMKV